MRFRRGARLDPGQVTDVRGRRGGRGLAVGGGGIGIGVLVIYVLFSLLTEFLRLRFPYAYLIVLGALLIALVLYLPGGLASLLARRRRPTRVPAPEGAGA